jgi:hypothetical protein
VTTDLRDSDAPRDVDVEARPEEVFDLASEPDLRPRDPTLLRRFGVDERALAGDEDGEEDAE